MSAVWRVARAAARRRRLQTIVIGVVVGVSTATMVLALGLLTSASAPFDRAHQQQSGAHLVAVFDGPGDGLAETAGRPAVAAAAGPFAQVTVDVAMTSRIGMPLTVAGRADPGGAVDRLTVWQGRWADAPGEIVLNEPPGEHGPWSLGERVDVAGGRTFTVVGFAYSVSRSADAWVTPAQMTALNPDSAQMLYRFTAAGTAEEIAAAETAVTAGLPLLGTQSYLTLKQEVAAETAVYIPLLIVFGVLGMAVAVLIVANVISGAVVAGYRHIGVLKALGFTSNQVLAVYLLMVTVPAVVGCVLGAVLGHVTAVPLLADAFAGFGTTEIAIDAWVYALAALGMPAVVVVTALLAALRARGLSAAQAISAGSAPSVGRALAVQRVLSGARLPRSVSLGLGVPFARPARSALTLAAIVLGVMTVTLASGVTTSVTSYRAAVEPPTENRVELLAAPPRGFPGPQRLPEPTLSDAEDEALLRSLPGAAAVAAVARLPVGVVGGDPAEVYFHRGDRDLGPVVLSGHWPAAPDEVAVPSRFLNQRGLSLGDAITVEFDGDRTRLRVVGVVLTNPADEVYASWSALTALAPGTRAHSYLVELRPGADRQAYVDAAADGDPGLTPIPPDEGGSSQAVVLIGFATLMTLVLAAVSALGVFNTVVLISRERRRDLGMLKSIGMTPRQVTVMMVTSMGVLGVVGGLIGLPLGVAAHALIAPAMMRAAQADVLDIVMDVYHAPLLALLALAGVVIAVLGAYLPARGAGRATIAEVLHTE
ncbi:ABC transporter permease [Actinokineospora sp. UTMC 2448]|uniref:ABC transporter permease n=1 Tax=Actinokineospora sp. UTMC 2448 TaxID=2268449 RepID=UPI002164C4C7|nr:ABC transporter permease [Actinokineospora sp. UTMC 2448]UVS80255.1 ABC transporter permease YtrF precursor [Actinokineospora sp. UTMC 2448]